MRTYEFTIIASGLNPDSDGFADRFFENGCDDATLSFQRGVIVLEFGREARNFVHAVVSAVFDVMRTGAKIERIEPDYLVSLSEIAKRSGLSRSAVSLFAKGERGADFPLPIARVTTDSPLWDWVDVSRWMRQRGKISSSVVVEAQVVRTLNRVTVERALDEELAPLEAVLLKTMREQEGVAL